jgi:hypothetical protein
LACYVHDSANREFDLVDAKGDTSVPGSDAILGGNVIVKARRGGGNRGVIHFGQDGGQEHDGTLWLVHNTIMTPFVSPVIQLSAAKARAECHRNIFWDGGRRTPGAKVVESSGLAAGGIGKQYRHPHSFEDRPGDGRPDMGAYEWFPER